MEKITYLVPAIRTKSVESENIMVATSEPKSVTGRTSGEEVTTGYADSKAAVYDLWDDDNFE